jgi:hypothetical protein
VITARTAAEENIWDNEPASPRRRPPLGGGSFLLAGSRRLKVTIELKLWQDISVNTLMF